MFPKVIPFTLGNATADHEEPILRAKGKRQSILFPLVSFEPDKSLDTTRFSIDLHMDDHFLRAYYIKKIAIVICFGAICNGCCIMSISYFSAVSCLSDSAIKDWNLYNEWGDGVVLTIMTLNKDCMTISCFCYHPQRWCNQWQWDEKC